MTSPAQPAGPPVARVDRQPDVLTALAHAGISSGRPVVVLIGGASGLDATGADAWLQLVRDGVVRPAAEAGAAVVDGGTDAGVMSLAGRARHELGSAIPLVGVAPRGKVATGHPNGAGGTALEPNHALVLLVPGDAWGAESPWLISVARALSGGHRVVAVLLDGGPVALAEARECALQGWPLIAVAGSGRSADVLAAAANEPGADPALAQAEVHVVEAAAGAPGLASKLAGLLAPRSRRPVHATQADTLPKLPRRPASMDYPALYVAASGAAKRGQTLHRRMSLAEIGLTTVGLAVILAAAWLEPVLALPSNLLTNMTIVISALSFLVALVLKFISRASAFDTDWYNGRALAETVKSLAWRYMMRTRPFEATDADRRFTVDLAQLLRRAPGFRQATDRLPPSAQQISPVMRDVRRRPIAERRAYYVSARVLDQAGWYQARSVAFGRAGTRWFWLSVLLQIAAAGLALTALAGGGDALLRVIAVLGSVALAVSAWSQLNRYDELARSYATAFQELTLIAAAAGDGADRAALEELVHDGEQAVEREHQLWVAKRREGPQGPSDIDDGGGDGRGDDGQTADVSSPSSVA